MACGDRGHRVKEVRRKKGGGCGLLPPAHNRGDKNKPACDGAGERACGDQPTPGDPLDYFEAMLPRCHAYAVEAKRAGRKIVGILCEFTPRELILAAGAVPVCLCGGSAKTIPAAEQELPANLCPLIKSTYGYHVQRSNPFLEMADLVVAETTCDGKKKMYELMGRTRPVYVLELPQKADDADALRHWVAEVRKLKGELERRFGVRITDCKLREAIRLMNRERRLRRRLAELMKADRPVLTGRQLITLKSSISGIEADLEQYEAVASGRLPVASNDHDRNAPPDGDAVNMCWTGGGKIAPANTAGVAPGEDRLKAGLRTPAEAGTPYGLPAAEADKPVRVLMTGVPMAHGAERVLEIIEGCGGLVVAMESCTGVKPILEDVDEDAADPLEAIAEKYFHLPCSVMTPNRRRLELLKDLAREYRVDCVIDLVWQACLTYDVEARLVKRTVEEELALPYLKIETDYSTSDSARIATRVEALLETVRGRQA